MNPSDKAVKRPIIQYLFWAILFFALILRLFRYADIPAGVNQDEAMGAMDAWALAQYGTDRFGTAWPVHFLAWGESQMSVLLAYTMIPFIKLFGFHISTIRISMVLISTLSIAVLYLTARQFFSKKAALAIMAFAAVNPWHFMQSRWALDCNLFPHVFLLAFYLLLLGLKKKRWLYLSMVFFGLTFYSYGIAVYTVPVFLFVYALWCLWQKRLTPKAVVISICIFLLVALPEILTMFINLFKLPTIETPLFTIPYFPESVRGNDILFLNFSFGQLAKNALALLKQVFLQGPDLLFNTLPAFGPLYHISTPFMLIGIVSFTKRFFKETEPEQKTVDLALLGFLIMGIWAGLITYEVNVNRINIIFYPLMFFTVCGITTCGRYLKQYASVFYRGLFVAYGILAVLFFRSYFTDFSEQIRTMFNVDFLALVQEADALDSYDTLYVSGNMGWQYNLKMAEILTQYGCRIDALYFQELTAESGGRSLLPYSERYHYFNAQTAEDVDTGALYIVHISDLDHLPDTYDVLLSQGEFLAVDFR